MTNVAVIGSQWGDEGKGKIVVGSQNVLTLWCVSKGDIMQATHL